MIYKEPSDKPGKVRVSFELPSVIWADRVHLCGDFNDWSETAMPLHQSRDDGAWRVTIELDAGQCYQFRYLVNGTEWHNDWNADSYVPNIHGGDNSVVDTTLEEDDT
ncbi:MAG: isoamylase early set domain-containing protein [Anaerolineae bacterium]